MLLRKEMESYFPKSTYKPFKPGAILNKGYQPKFHQKHTQDVSKLTLNNVVSMMEDDELFNMDTWW